MLDGSSSFLPLWTLKQKIAAFNGNTKNSGKSYLEKLNLCPTHVCSATLSEFFITSAGDGGSFSIALSRQGGVAEVTIKRKTPAVEESQREQPSCNKLSEVRGVVEITCPD